jgi:hypothetical protein
MFTLAPGGSADFEVLIENRGLETVHLTGVSSTLTPSHAASDLYDLFVASGPRSLGPGEGWEGVLLHLTIDPGTELGSTVFGVTLTGGGHPYDSVELSTVYFIVNVAEQSGAEPPAAPVTVPPELRAAPNPFGERTAVHFRLAAPGTVQVDVFDVTGHPVRALYHGAMSAGGQRLEWDGLADTGEKSPRGIYFIRVRSESFLLTTKVVRIE